MTISAAPNDHHLVRRYAVQRHHRDLLAGRGSPPPAGIRGAPPATASVVRDVEPSRAGRCAGPRCGPATPADPGTSAAAPRCGDSSTSVQSSTELRQVSGSCGSGISSASHPYAANSRRRPVRTASASSGSPWSVKYRHGVDAPHSSPMNSIGVYGEVSTSAAPIASWPGVSAAGRPARDCRPGRGSTCRRGTPSRDAATDRPADPSPSRGRSSRTRRAGTPG